MRYNALFAIVLSLLLMVSCRQQKGSNTASEEVQQLRQELEEAYARQAEADSIQMYRDDFIDTIAEALDSIKRAEGILTLRVNEYGQRLPKREILENLQLLGTIIESQRDRIDQLEAELLASRDSTSHYVTLIRHLRAQINEKEAEIVRLRQDLGDKDIAIRNLNAQVSSLEEKNRIQAATIEEQTVILSAQDEMVNMGYVLISTKKELKAKGLLAWSKIQYDKIKPEDFFEVDMREFREVMISSTKAKILTNMPSASYSIERKDGSSILTILDPAYFWSLSNYLIIQTD